MRGAAGRGTRVGVVVAGLLAGACAGGGPEEGDAGAPAPSDTPAAALPDGALPPGPAAAPLPAAAPGLPAPAAGTDETADADTTGSQWTVGIVDRRRPQSGTTVLRSVRSAPHPGFDRVVFEFGGERVPGYHLEYVDRPVRQCGSGDPVPIAGDAWLAVRLEPSQAHDDQGRATVEDRQRALSLPVLRELRSICDFEGQVEWVLGVASPNRFRVLELASPARLVVDVRR